MERNVFVEMELKKWSPDDDECFAELYNKIDRSFLSPNPCTEEAAKNWINMAIERDGKRGVFRKITMHGATVGSISVKQKEDVYSIDADIGYLLLTEEWSKGIMTEAVKQICEIAFRELSILRITGLVYERNIASKKVLEKNGFVLEGVMKNAVMKDEVLTDLCIYGKYK